jgi:hypothetical protein
VRFRKYFFFFDQFWIVFSGKLANAEMPCNGVEGMLWYYAVYTTFEFYRLRMNSGLNVGVVEERIFLMSKSSSSAEALLFVAGFKLLFIFKLVDYGNYVYAA